jgi:hypothetical protein
MWRLSKDGERLREALEYLSSGFISVSISPEKMIKAIMMVTAEYTMRKEPEPEHLRGLIEWVEPKVIEEATDE